MKNIKYLSLCLAFSLALMSDPLRSSPCEQCRQNCEAGYTDSCPTTCNKDCTCCCKSVCPSLSDDKK